jgi:xanthine dehydrogenase small subunit
VLSRPLKKVFEQYFSSTSSMLEASAFPQLNESAQKTCPFWRKRIDGGLFQRPVRGWQIPPRSRRSTRHDYQRGVGRICRMLPYSSKIICARLWLVTTPGGAGMPQQDKIRFLLNDREIAVPDVGAGRMLLDFLRIEPRLTGTKEGCAEGDCGACTVLVGRLEGGTLRYEPVNACIRFLASVDGCHVVTVEHLAGSDGALNPVQRAMVAEHGSQCGFCTPGIVMALYALWMENPEPDEAQIETALQGNLCRCTGYAPIIRAAQAASRYGPPAADRLSRDRARVTAALLALRDGARVVTGPEEDRAILPADPEDFAQLYADTPNAAIVAGATDVGLWVTKFLRPIGPVIFIGHLDELKRIAVGDSDTVIGAGVSYSDLSPVIAAHFPSLAEYWHRIAGWQVRNAGTIGGNIANGSPIGDTPPPPCPRPDRGGLQGRQASRRGYFLGGNGDFGGAS